LSGTVLQKLLMPWLSDAVAAQGYWALGGPVVAAADAAALTTPSALLRAYGFDGPGSPFGDTPAYVDVLRFESHPLMHLERPRAGGPRPWPTYDSGFLRAETVVPVWTLERTRVPAGTELWRMGADGHQQMLTVYAGAAVGWRGARGYFPPVHLVGPRAVWGGAEYPADLSLDRRAVELVHVGPDVPPGFEAVRPQVSRRVVPVGECERVFDLVLTARWHEVPVRVLQPVGERALVLLLTDDPEAARRLGAGEVEPGVFEATAPVAELTGTAGTTRELGAG
jgi:hypothetical protein